MKQKKLFALLTSLIILLSAVCIGLSDAGLIFVCRDDMPQGEMIVALSKAPGEKLLSQYGLSLLGGDIYVASRADALRLKAEYGDLVRYVEDNIERKAAINEAMPDPTEKPYEYPMLELQKAHELTKGDKDTVIAVLDTGVKKSDISLSGAHILDGYDTSSGTAVVSDATGHGTKICSLIYAVAPDCTIMPVKVSRGSSTIYTSDLIKGLHYAADNGAKIINLSFGGYNYSYAEQEAVDYCVSKGCILIAAVGNDGMTALADQPNYPACYEGVIGVGSIGKDWQESEFSQSMGADIFAPGEMITLKTDDGVSAENGTSYSAAFVSGTAALCASICRECRFETGEYEFLITLCGTQSPSTLKMTEASLYPAVTGVSDKAEYANEVYIYFNRGTAYLDGEEIDDGERVFIRGQHTLVVSHLGRSVTVSFSITSSGPEYTKRSQDGAVVILFESGDAYLDGVPYAAGQPITAEGEHYFEITAGGVTLSETFLLEGECAVFGASDNANYQTPIAIYLTKEAMLDGTAVSGEIFVGEGEHVLMIGEREINFYVGDKREVYSPLGGSTAVGGGDRIAVFKKGVAGITLFDIHDLSKAALFISTSEPVTDCTVIDQDVAALMQTQIAVFDAVSGNIISTHSISEQCLAVNHIGERIYYISQNTLFTIQDGVEAALCTSDAKFDSLSCSEGSIALYDSMSDDGKITLYNTDTSTASVLSVDASQLGKKILLDETRLICGRHVFDLQKGELLLETDVGDVICISNGAYICKKGAADLATGAVLCKYDSEALFAFDTAEKLVIAFADKTVTESASDIFGYGGYAVCDAFVPRKEGVLFKNDITSVCNFGSGMLLTAEGDRNVYYYDGNQVTVFEVLPFVPDKVFADGEKVFLTFKNKKLLMLVENDGFTSITVPSPVEAMAFCDGRVFMLISGTLAELQADKTILSYPLVSATAIAATDGRLITASRRNINVFGIADMTMMYSLKCRDNAYSIVVSQSLAAAGETVFDIASGTVLVGISGDAKAFANDYLFASGGIFNAQGEALVSVSHFSLSASKALVVGGDLVAVYGSALQKHDISALYLPELVSGIADGGIYKISASLTVNAGLAYLDGKQITDTATVSDGGIHTLRVVLSPGITLKYSFSVVPELGEIVFSQPELSIGVGETCVLKLLFLPFGAESSELIFVSSDENVLTVDTHGTVTAVSPGDATVTAYTSNRTLSAVCNIRVLEDPIRFSSESGILVDRPYSTAYHIPLGTTVDEILLAAGSHPEMRILGTDGVYVTEGIVATGMRIELYHDGILHDAMTLSVVGDTDGDGYSTVLDLLMISDINSGMLSPTAEVEYAADVNMDGKVSGSDLLRIRGQLLFKHRLYGDSTPPVTADTDVMLTASRHGDTVDVLISINGITPDYLTGRLIFDGTKLVMADLTAPFASVEHTQADSYLSFIIKLDKTAKNDLLVARFKVVEDAEISLDSISVAIGKSVFSADTSGKTCKTAARQDGIEVANALRAIDFDESVLEYNVTLPTGSIMAMVSAPSNAAVSETLVADRQKFDITVRMDGRQYILHCFVADKTVPDSNSRIGEIKVDGARLVPNFKPDIHEYILVSDSDKMPLPTITAQSKYATVKTDIVDGVITIVCTAEDGSQTVYTVTLDAKLDDTSSETPSPDSDSSEPPTTDVNRLNVVLLEVAIAVLTLAATAAAIISAKKKHR